MNKNDLLLKTANEIISKLMNDLEENAPEAYYQNDTILKGDKWHKYYFNEAESEEEEQEIIKDLKTLN